MPLHFPNIKPLRLLSALLFLPILLSGQNHLKMEGTIKDGSTQAVIPYASIYVKEKGIGTISDFNGNFILSGIAPNDTVKVSFIGYTTLVITLKESVAGKEYFLQSKPERLKEVTILASDEFLYHLTSKISKTQTRQSRTAKSYYNLSTTLNSRRVELLESYYNGTYSGYDVDALDLKTGRIALNGFDNRYFVSTETSRVMFLHKLFDKNPFLPDNPLSFGSARVKRLYDLHLESKFTDNDTSVIYAIGFSPKDTSGHLFSGTLWVDSARYTLQKIELDIRNASVHPFVPHGNADSLANVGMTISHTYEHQGDAMYVKSIDFKYSLTYSTRFGNLYTTQTRAVLYAYSYEETFKLPFFNFSNSEYVDYRKISAAPYNPFFWEHLDEFQGLPQEGRLLFMNHPRSLTSQKLFTQGAFRGKNFFEHPYVFWSTNRIFFASDSVDYSIYNRQIPATRYHLNAQIYMDINHTADSSHILTASVFDPFESYYHFPPTPEGNAFINMYFDLVEIYRRKLEKRLSETSSLKDSAGSIYHNTIDELNLDSERFFKEMDHGTYLPAMLQWNEYINEELQIDNLRLFGLRKSLNDGGN